MKILCTHCKVKNNYRKCHLTIVQSSFVWLMYVNWLSTAYWEIFYFCFIFSHSFFFVVDKSTGAIITVLCSSIFTNWIGRIRNWANLNLPIYRVRVRSKGNKKMSQYEKDWKNSSEYWILTSHRLMRPVSCMRDQMAWTRPAFSGWFALLPHVHWCFCMIESYAIPEKK